MQTSLPAFLIAVLFSSLLSSDADSRSRPLQKNIDIKVHAKNFSFDQVNPNKKHFGRLTWRGGLVLSSKQKKFGGYSGLVLTNKGKKLIAISDQGTWLQASVRYKNGALSGLKQPHIGPLRKKSGKVLRRKKNSDAEDIALWRNKKGVYALISFERKHRIGRFSMSSDGLSKAFSYMKLPRSVFKTTKNKGLESLTVLTDKNNKGTVLTFLERHDGKKNMHRGWLICGKKSWPLYLKSHNDFMVTGMTTLANGNVLVLERYFSYFAGVQMRIREIKAEKLRKNAILDGEILITATMRYNIDNMEGISAHTNARGEQIITLMSDDNFNKSGLQRTLLMQFKLD